MSKMKRKKNSNGAILPGNALDVCTEGGGELIPGGGDCDGLQEVSKDFLDE